MNKKLIRFINFLIGTTVLILSACSSAEIPTPISNTDIDIQVPTEVPASSDSLSPTSASSTAVEVITSGEKNVIFHIQGEGINASPVFEISEATPIQVKWEYANTDQFSIELINANLTAEAESQIISFNIINTSTQQSGAEGLILPAGEYQIAVGNAIGNWEVQLLIPTQEFENISEDKELLKVMGESTGLSIPFFIETTFSIQLDWTKSPDDNFQVVLERLDAENDSDRFINLNFMNAQEIGEIKMGLIPGEYRVIVINASLPWEITISQ